MSDISFMSDIISHHWSSGIVWLHRCPLFLLEKSEQLGSKDEQEDTSQSRVTVQVESDDGHVVVFNEAEGVHAETLHSTRPWFVHHVYVHPTKRS